MQYIEAPNTWPTTGVRVFLAGGIGNCPNWQEEAVDMFNGTDLVVLNPRRESFDNPWTRANSEEQITWEFEALEAADIILFWFPGCESVQPIALFELGKHAARGDNIVVGCDPGYSRRDDVEIQLGLLLGNFHVYRSLAAVCDAVEQKAEWIMTCRGAI